MEQRYRRKMRMVHDLAIQRRRDWERLQEEEWEELAKLYGIRRIYNPSRDDYDYEATGK